MESRCASLSMGYWELYFEKRFRIIYTIDLNNHIVNIEAVWHKDEF